MIETVALEAPAKVNLRLCILAREQTGFHALETLFCAVSLSDEVCVSRAGAGLAFRVQGAIDTGPPERNLCMRAAQRFYRELGREPEVSITLVKRIPAAAGLGGGSADAAATLRALNALHGGLLPRATLLQLGSELGSDVPFFLCGSPLALGWGRGERLLALPPLAPRPVLIAHPGEPMPTPEAFRRLSSSRGEDYRPPAFSFALEDLASWERIAALAQNDFESVADERIPRLVHGRAQMRKAGAEIALLAGSGASLFGIFRTAESRDAAAEPLERLGFTVWAAETLADMPVPRPDASRAAD